ncbi:DUF4937 domain-containing protein [Guptibacillus spartinae]|uniref:DUF4937 domain-containing protein n=1 Tax=Guptibacillus spartinae TaxID=3025679 RepID=UPI00235F4615|nr:DUF4937 domain-containing protein [Pseudalkalibacillus spartinae]
MLIKKVVCHVKEEMKETFLNGQERWSDLCDCKGFVAQFGGWSDENVAMIIGFWKNYQSYVRFMNEEHDAIYMKSNQRDCIKSINIQVEEIDVREINNYASKWLNERNGEIHSQWTVTTDNLEGS